MMESNRSVLPNQQNTYSKDERSSCSMRAVMPWLKGVSTTTGMCSLRALMSRAMSKVSLLSVPGMTMMRSNEFFPSSPQASSAVLTWVKRGG